MDSGKVEIDWLKGVRVVLIGHYVPAPMAAYFLRMLGAEVIKVEQDQGDYLRQVGLVENTDRDSFSPMFRMLNAGFKSVGLQWKTPQGAEVLKNILAKADILLDGGRMKSLEKALGMPPEQVSDRLIYIPITAYGQKGPMANLAGHDNNILALAGNLSYTQKNADGLPTVFSAPVADLFAGQMAAFGALAALIGQDRGSKGIRKIDASMLHAGFFLNLLEVAARNDQGAETPEPETAWMNGGRADYQSYRCKDGKVIFFGLLEAWGLKRFLQAINRADILMQTHDQQAFKQSLGMLFLERNQAEWVELGRIHDACITPVNDLEEALEDPQIQALGLMQTVVDPDLGQLELPGFPLGFGETCLSPELPNSAPRLGEHSREVLADLLGYKEEHIAELLRKGIISVE